ncbi:MAG: stage II sporulation protein M [Bacillota bacterium]
MWTAWKSLWVFKQNWPLYLIAAAFFILGAGLGVLTVNNLPAEQTAEIHSYLNVFLKQIEILPLDSTRAARAILYENIIFISIIYFLGLTFVGIPFILGLVLGRGFILGFAVSCLTKTMSWPGFFLAAAAILPQNLLYLPALLIGVVTAISFASLSFKRHSNYRVKLWNCLVGYTFIMLTVMAMTLGAGLIEAYFSPWLTRLTSGLIRTTL